MKISQYTVPSSLLCHALLLVTGLLLLPVTGAAESGTRGDKFTEAQKVQIGEIAADWLVQHPEYLAAAAETLRQQQQSGLAQLQKKAILSGVGTLKAGTDIPATGPADAGVVVTFFFDYQCCTDGRGFVSTLSRLQEEYPEVRFVFREYPVLASRWPVSGHAARTGRSVMKNGGTKAWLKYFSALLSEKRGQGTLTEDDVRDAAGGTYTDISDREWQVREASLLSAGKVLQLDAPLTVVVMPSSGADEESVTVLSGTVTEQLLRRALLRATPSNPS